MKSHGRHRPWYINSSQIQPTPANRHDPQFPLIIIIFQVIGSCAQNSTRDVISKRKNKNAPA